MGGVAMGVMAVQMIRKAMGSRALKRRLAKAEAERRSRARAGATASSAP